MNKVTVTMNVQKRGVFASCDEFGKYNKDIGCTNAFITMHESSQWWNL